MVNIDHCGCIWHKEVNNRLLSIIILLQDLAHLAHEEDTTVQQGEDTDDEELVEGHHLFFKPNISNIIQRVNNPAVVQRGREMFATGDYMTERKMLKNGWRYWVKSARVKDVTYITEVTWSDNYDNNWEDSVVMKCMCPYYPPNCKHMVIMMLHCGKRQ